RQKIADTIRQLNQIGSARFFETKKRTSSCLYSFRHTVAAPIVPLFSRVLNARVQHTIGEHIRYLMCDESGGGNSDDTLYVSPLFMSRASSRSCRGSMFAVAAMVVCHVPTTSGVSFGTVVADCTGYMSVVCAPTVSYDAAHFMPCADAAVAVIAILPIAIATRINANASVNLASFCRPKSSCAATTTTSATVDSDKPVPVYKQDTIETRQLDEDEDDLSEVQSEAVPIEVRKWLETTFTRNSISQKRQSDDKLKFRSVANAIRAGIVVDKIYRRMSGTSPLVSPEVANLLKQIDDWSFDCFSVNQLSNGQVLKSVAYELFNRYGLLYKFKIPTTTMRNFLTQVEAGYVKHKNPYHNNLHAADVTQTVHYMLLQGLANWLTDLEIFATLFAAIVHDYLHTGTTNNFHVMSRSETALVYNDRSVLENFHVSAAFRLLLEDDCNILANLSNDDYREFRSLVIDMVLATDMSSHFQQIKAMKTILNHSEFNADKSKVLSLVIHVSDISHPAKKWELHSHWTQLLMKEFFRQGDKEKQLNLECSPLCDRDTTLVAESQLGFIEFIVNPSMEVCGDVLDRVQLLILGSRACTSPLAIGSTGSGAPCTASGPATTSPGVVQASSSSYQTTKPPRRIASLPPSTNSTRSNSSTRQFSVAATSTNPFEDNQPQQYGEPQHAQDKASAASGTTCATNSIKYDIKPAFQHPVIKFQQSDFKSLAPDPPPRSLQPHTKSASGQLSADGDSRETRVISSAPATPVPSSQVVAQYKIKRPWIECLERNKRMWQERAVLGLDAMI
ncbi:Calcium/calmodulin-dependent 3',5'-cyclic nucleotide phosphodiesterase 1, partial [Fragariocoptes setiger]